MKLFDVFFPRRCVRCGRVGRYFCDQCQNGIKIIASNESICPVCEKLAIDGATHPRCRTTYGIDGLTSFFHYDGIVKNAVKTIKYRYVSDLATEFFSLVPPLIVQQLKKQSIDMVVPIPLHPARERLRGFNQAEVLGRLLASELGILVKTKIVQRVKHVAPQVAMKKREDRLKNMTGVFAVHADTKKLYKGTGVILVDDVFTTGATMRAAASVLKRAGIQYVWAVTMAR